MIMQDDVRLFTQIFPKCTGLQFSERLQVLLGGLLAVQGRAVDGVGWRRAAWRGRARGRGQTPPPLESSVAETC